MAEAPSDPPAVRGMRALTVALGAVLVVLSLWVVVQRFRHPVDAEWLTGAIRDGVDRVRDGKQLYVAPSTEFIPFVYPPLYFWVSALVAHGCSTFVACKMVSIAATVTAGWGLFRIARRLGATAFWSWVSLLLYVASYSLTLLFYDLERVDALLAAMVVVGLAALFWPRPLASAITAGAILGLAFFAKQSGLLVFAAVVAALFVAGERRRAAIVLASGALVLVGVGLYLENRTGGWFRYYCVELPRAHGIRAERLSLFFIVDAPKAFAITAGSVAVSVPVLWRLGRQRRKPDDASWQDVVFAVLVVATMAAAFSFRAHAGGWANVLMVWLPLGCAATAVAATRAEARAQSTNAAPLTTLVLLGGISLQLLGAVFDPTELAPNADDMRDRERLITLVRELELQGDVIVLPMGSVTKQTHFHVAALDDIVRTGRRAPTDLLEGFERRRFVALFVDEPVDCALPSCDEIGLAIGRNYFVAARRHEREHTGMTGYDGRPRWILRPRKTPLPDEGKDELRSRQLVERGFATMRSARTPRDTEVRPSDDIEELAARELTPRGPEL